mgnify:CR=1 FL=1
MIEVIIVKIELNKVLSKISHINLNWKASRINNIIWCNNTESSINEKRTAVSDSFSLMVWYS